MKEIIVTASTANRRLDKFLQKHMDKAPKSWLYKMLRKKNITLNGRRAAGNEILTAGDVVTLFLADKTIAVFKAERAARGCGYSRSAQISEFDFSPLQGSDEDACPKARKEELTRKGGKSAGKVCADAVSTPSRAVRSVAVEMIYEDDHILVCNKPAGVLSHPEKAGDRDTMIDRVLCYLRGTGAYDPAEAAFTPALCNRLDRNTSGVLLCGKTLPALQALNKALAERTMTKYYRAVVCGELIAAGTLDGHMSKASVRRMAIVHPGGKPALTHYTPVLTRNGFTVVRIQLVSGKFHQIRAHFSAAGHPIAGDVKYGDARVNERFRRRVNVRGPLLHAERVVYDGQTFDAPPPPVFQRAIDCIVEGRL